MRVRVRVRMWVRVRVRIRVRVSLDTVFNGRSSSGAATGTDLAAKPHSRRASSAERNTYSHPTRPDSCAAQPSCASAEEAPETSAVTGLAASTTAAATAAAAAVLPNFSAAAAAAAQTAALLATVDHKKDEAVELVAAEQAALQAVASEEVAALKAAVEEKAAALQAAAGEKAVTLQAAAKDSAAAVQAMMHAAQGSCRVALGEPRSLLEQQ